MCRVVLLTGCVFRVLLRVFLIRFVIVLNILLLLFLVLLLILLLGGFLVHYGDIGANPGCVLWL